MLLQPPLDFREWLGFCTGEGAVHFTRSVSELQRAVMVATQSRKGPRQDEPLLGALLSRRPCGLPECGRLLRERHRLSCPALCQCHVRQSDQAVGDDRMVRPQ